MGSRGQQKAPLATQELHSIYTVDRAPFVPTHGHRNKAALTHSSGYDRIEAVPPLRPFWWRGNGLGRGSASAIWWGYAPLFLCGLGGGHTPNRERTERAPAKHLQPGGMWGMGWPHQQRLDSHTHCLPGICPTKERQRYRRQCRRQHSGRTPHSHPA